MAFPVIESTTKTAFTTGTAHLVNMPASVATDNLLLLFFVSRNGTHTTPSGWGLLGTAGPGGSGNLNLSVFTKKSDNTEGGTTVDVVTSASAPACAVVHQISAWNGTVADDIDINGTWHFSAGTDAPDVIATTAGWGGSEDNMWIQIHGCRDDDETYSGVSASYTNLEEIVSGGGANAGATAATCRRELAADSENPAAMGLTASQTTGGNLIVIRPGSAGGAPGGGGTSLLQTQNYQGMNRMNGGFTG